MMLASGQVCYGCSKAGTSPLWFGVTLTVRSDRPKTPTHNTRNSALCGLLSSKAGTQPLWAPLIVGVSSAFAYSE